MHNGGREALFFVGVIKCEFREAADFYGGVGGKGWRGWVGTKKIDCLTTTNLN